MRYIKEILVDATKLPAAIEEKLPSGAPSLSKLLADTANRLPTGPGLPIEIPVLPTPKFPDLPELPGGGLGFAPRPVGDRWMVTKDDRSPLSLVGSRGRL